ncbi:MAG: hypothetical protein ACYTFI_03905, partial [Planctomycetota bacterium]
MPTDPLDLARLSHFPFAERRSLVSADVLREPPAVGAEFTGAASVVADAEAASRIERLAGLLVRARKGGRPVALGMGANPVKL